MSARMTAHVKIDQRLRHWVEHNLDRGCPPEQLIEGMVAQRFDLPIAQGVVRAFVDARISGVPLTAETITIEVPTAYMYGRQLDHDGGPSRFRGCALVAAIYCGAGQCAECRGMRAANCAGTPALDAFDSGRSAYW